MAGPTDDDPTGLMFTDWAIVELHRSGWSIGYVAAEANDGGRL